MRENTPDLPRCLWLWAPLAAMGLQILLEITLPLSVLAPLLSENGPHEFLQAAVLIAGLGVALATLTRLSAPNHPGLFAWVALAALCQMYVAGEELSWGQHLFGWTTPETWSVVNDQDETNLHNTSDWLDQKPRALLMISVLVGGLIVPFVAARRPEAIPSHLRILLPDTRFAPVALMVLTVRLSSVVRDTFGPSLFERASEVSELGLYWFVFLYMILLHGRFKDFTSTRVVHSPRS